jgi:hypothetical protein
MLHNTYNLIHHKTTNGSITQGQQQATNQATENISFVSKIPIMHSHTGVKELAHSLGVRITIRKGRISQKSDIVGWPLNKIELMKDT